MLNHNQCFVIIIALVVEMWIVIIKWPFQSLLSPFLSSPLGDSISSKLMALLKPYFFFVVGLEEWLYVLVPTQILRSSQKMSRVSFSFSACLPVLLPSSPSLNLSFFSFSFWLAGVHITFLSPYA